MSENKCPIRPLADRVVARPLTQDEMENVTASGIFIAGASADQKPQQGVVLAVGPGKWDEDGEKRLVVDVKEGDKIIFSKFALNEVKVAGKEYYLIGEEGILGVFE